MRREDAPIPTVKLPSIFHTRKAEAKYPIKYGLIQTGGMVSASFLNRKFCAIQIVIFLLFVLFYHLFCIIFLVE